MQFLEENNKKDHHGGYLPPDGIVRLDGCGYILKFKRTLQSSKDDIDKALPKLLTEALADVCVRGDVMASGWLKEEEDGSNETEEAPTR